MILCLLWGADYSFNFIILLIVQHLFSPDLCLCLRGSCGVVSMEFSSETEYDKRLLKKMPLLLLTTGTKRQWP